MKQNTSQTEVVGTARNGKLRGPGGVAVALVAHTDAKRMQLRGSCPFPHAQFNAATGDLVESCNAFRDPVWLIGGDLNNAVTQPDLFRALAGGSEKQFTDALRVYSDDMRHKRLSRAEEKAYALPAKLSLPMMICIFPVLFVVILLPVIVRVTLHKF